MLSSDQILRRTRWSSLIAKSLDLYCSTGIVSGPAALSHFGFLMHTCILLMKISGTISALSIRLFKSTTGSLSRAANFCSRNFAHSSSCCSELVIMFPSWSTDGCTKELPFGCEESDFAFRWMSEVLPSAIFVSKSLRMSFT